MTDFYNGKPCDHCQGTYRYAKSRNCVNCQRAKSKGRRMLHIKPRAPRFEKLTKARIEARRKIEDRKILRELGL